LTNKWLYDENKNHIDLITKTLRFCV